MHVTHDPASPPAPEIAFDDFLAVDIRVNFPPRQIGPMRSEVLTLGFPDAQGKVVLVQPSRTVPAGGRLF